MDRRISPRADIHGPYFVNKYIDGHPYLAQLLDLSPEGMLLRTTIEPSTNNECYSIELALPGTQHRVWLWARNIRKWNDRQALQLIGTEMLDRAYLSQLVRWHLGWDSSSLSLRFVA